jgi:ferritin-like metal-binding protein YciE
VRGLFADKLREMLGVELALRNDVLPTLRERASAPVLKTMLDHHLVETNNHVTNVRRVLGYAGVPDVPLEAALARPPESGDLDILAFVLRIEAVEVASYTLLVQLARALEVDEQGVRLLCLTMEQDAYAGEAAQHALAEMLAETSVRIAPAG